MPCLPGEIRKQVGWAIDYKENTSTARNATYGTGHIREIGFTVAANRYARNMEPKTDRSG